MSNTETTRIPTALTARAEATIDGRVRTSRPVPFTPAGAMLTAHARKMPDGEIAFSVTLAPPPSPGMVRFEKTCFELVTFTLFDANVPIHQAELRSTFDGVTVELIAPQ